MLDVEAALAATLGASSVTVLTLYGVSKYDNEFKDTDSWLWCMYAVTALLTYLMTIAMALTKINDIGYAALTFSGVSSTSLSLWIMQQSLPPPPVTEDTEELLRDADHADTEAALELSCDEKQNK